MILPVLLTPIAVIGQADQRAALQRALDRNPNDAESLKALFYLDIAQHRTAQALPLAERYLQTHRDDAFKLDYAYALLDFKQTATALRVLGELQQSTNREIAMHATLQKAQSEDEGGEKALAAVDYRSYLRYMPKDAQSRLSLAYIDSSSGNHTAALSDLDSVLALRPADQQALLQRAYELAALQRGKEALAGFRELENSPDASVAKTARVEVVAAASSNNPSVERGSVYGYVQNESRFADTFYGVDARYDLKYPVGSAIVPYVILHYSNDTRSGVPGQSEIFNDNAAVLDGGLRKPIGNYAYIFIEAGQSVGLRGQRSFAESRYGVAYSREFGAAGQSASHSALDGSVAAYSRFGGNPIAYVTLEHDFKLAAKLRAEAGLNLGLDGKRKYFNNYLEGFAGLQVPLGPNVAIHLDRVYGSYLARGTNRDVPGTYSSTRALLTFGFGFK
ncbi:MAG: hypothetical protein M3Y21_03835 [Candidatus Eremiobacteraeota bacterium]|nr:hypothetical protein [Candidatus Eremiobacteraeota bacterium]